MSLTALVLFVFTALMTMSNVAGFPVVSLNPTNGTQGTEVRITGIGFTPSGQINANLWNGTTATSFTADVNGNLNTTVTVPAVAIGVYIFRIVDVATNDTALASFIVAQSNLPTPSVPEISSIALVLSTLIAGSALLVVARKKVHQQSAKRNRRL